jgi:histidyl-tRNA synthetase
MRVQKCKGTKDLTPEEMNVFRLIEDVFRKSCTRWDYQEVRTPTIEYLYLFTSAGTLTPGMLGRVYSFLDWDGWSGERVVLKPDGTIPVARMYVDCMEDKSLARLFYVTNIFIFEETGRDTREKWQCGVELIGEGSHLADTELIMLALEILNSLKVGSIKLRLSHAGLIKALLARLELTTEEQTRVFDQILDGDVEILNSLRPGHTELDRALFPLLSLKSQSAEFLKNLKALCAENFTEIGPHLDDFINTVNLLEAVGCEYQIDIASGAGFEYYTGVIFQLYIGDTKVGGGGRYDALVPAMGGRDIPASGFALYLDRLMNMVKPDVLARKPSPEVLITFNPGNTDAVKEGLGVASRLRQLGYIARLALGKSEPSGSRWILDIGEGAPFILKDTTSKSEKIAETVSEVLELLGGKSAVKDSPAQG